MASKLPKCPLCGWLMDRVLNHQVYCVNASCPLNEGCPVAPFRALCALIAKLRAFKPAGKVVAREYWDGHSLRGNVKVFPSWVEVEVRLLEGKR